MAVKTDFSVEEWDLITLEPLKVAILASRADRGLIAFVRELSAYSEAVKKAIEKYRGNQFVLSVLEEDTDAREEEIQDQIEGKHDDDPVFDGMKKELALVSELIASKCPAEESLGFREMLYGIADAVVNASGEKALGTGPALSKKEAVFMEELKGILKL